MPYELEETGALERVASVTVPSETFRRSYNKALKQLSKRVRIPGFRKGKIPLSVMKRNYGDAVIRDVIEEIVDEQIKSLLDDVDGVIFLGQPQVTSIPAGDEDMHFTVDFELRPSIDPIGYMGVEVGKPAVEIDDEAVDERIEALRKEHATLQPIAIREEIAEGDSVTLDFKALGDDEELDQLAGEGVTVVVGSGQALPGIEDALIGQAFDAVINTTIQIEDNFPIESLRDRDVELELVVKSVKKEVLPEVDDEFALDTGMGKTLIEMRTNIREELAEDLNARANGIARDNLLDALIAQNDFELPPKFLEQQTRQAVQMQLEQLMQQGIDFRQLGINPEDMVGNMKDSQAKQIKRDFLLMAIADTEDVEVEQDDVNAAISREAAGYNVDDNTYRNFLQSDRDRYMQFVGSVRLEKTIDLLLSEASFVDVDWPEDAPALEAAGDEEE